MALSLDQFITLLGALTALLGAVGYVIAQLHVTQNKLDGRLTQLLEQTSQAAYTRGQAAPGPKGAPEPLQPVTHLP